MNVVRRLSIGITLKWLATALIIGAVLLFVNGETLISEVMRIPPVAIATGLGLGVGQVFLSAWRWKYTASLVGLQIPYMRAVREYYLATFTNQVLPGGVLGDVNRALRHGADSRSRVAAAHAVAIERLSGQVVLAVVVVSGLAWLFYTGRVVGGERPDADSLPHVCWLFAVIVALILPGWFLVRKSERVSGYFVRLRGDLAKALFSWPALPVQVVTSLLVIASYLAVFIVLANGADYIVDLPSGMVVTALCSLLLLSMVVPLTVSGWGVREGAAVILWPMVGLPSEQGVALSVTYGALIFISSLPGALFLFSSLAGRR